MKFGSIRWRLVFSYVLLAALAVGLVGALALTLLGRYIYAQASAQLQANARAIAQQVEPLLTPVPRISDLQDFTSSLSFLGQVRVRILDANEHLLVDSGLPGESTSVVWMQSDPNRQDGPAFLVPLSPNEQNGPYAQRLRNNPNGRGSLIGSLIVRVEQGPWGRHMVFESVGGIPAGNSTAQAGNFPNGNGPTQSAESTPSANITKGNGALTVVSVRYPVGSPADPQGYIQLDSPFASGEQILAAMRRALLLAGLGAVMVAAAAGLLVSRQLTAPILTLAESASRMSSGDLSARAPERGAGEIGQLACQFNHMAGRLQTSFTALSAERDALRRFIADASHELRTPVTALGNFIELLQGPAAGDDAARAEFLAESGVQVRRMEWITANLLDLSRLDAGLVALDRQPHDLGELLQTAAAPFLVRMQQKGVHLTVTLPDPPVEIICDSNRMEMALGNLLNNALKFTAPGGQVVLRGEGGENGARIEVGDTGSGISPDDLPNIFERFYRGRTSEEGSGLGLAIVKSIVQAHGGQVMVESSPGNGSRFTIYI